jgi:hypothetical protein
VGHLVLSPVLIEIVALIRQVVRTLGEQAWRQGRVQLVLETSDLEVWGLADEQRLAQVLVSLLHDAVRHTLPGGVVMVRVENQAGAAVIRVQDISEGTHLAPLQYGEEPTMPALQLDLLGALDIRCDDQPPDKPPTQVPVSAGLSSSSPEESPDP